MRFCKKLNTLFILLILNIGVVLAGPALAAVDADGDDQSHLLIRSANFSQQAEKLILNTEIEITFSDAINQVLLKGFKLHYVLEFQLSVARKYWFNDEIITVTRPIDISYHALSRQYILMEGNQRKSFSQLSSLAEELSTLTPLTVLSMTLLEPDQPYIAAVLMRLDYRKLPSTIRQSAKQSWQMTSQRAQWQPSLFK